MNWREEQIEVFDKMANSGFHSYLYTDESLELLDKIIPKNVKILDLGCGTGHIAEVLKGREWHGIDISPESINTAKHFYKTAKIGDITEKLPYRNKSFDCVLLLSTLHHVPPEEHENIIKESIRLLKPEGKLIIVDHNKNKLISRITHSPKSFVRIVPCKHEDAVDAHVLRFYINNNSEMSCISFNDEVQIYADQAGLKAPFIIRALRAMIILPISLFSKNGDFILIGKKAKGQECR